MKKQLLSLITILLLGAAQIYAQCTPNPAFTVPGVYPDTIVNLDTATEAQMYSDTLQFKVYSTVGPATVDSVKILSINNLPAGITPSSNPPGMVFAGGANGCVLASGTPTTPGIYPLSIMLRFYGNVSGFPAQIDTPVTGYRIVVMPASGIPNVNSLSFSVLQNVPNPFDASTEISFIVPASGKVDLKVIDLLGKEIINRKIDAVAGVNKEIINRKIDDGVGTNKNYGSSRYIKPGIYFYAITFRNKTITRKLIVAARP